MSAKKKILKIAVFICVFSFSILTMGKLAYSWLKDMTSTKPEMTAGVKASYFESGTGKADDPYEIARPVQLYYLAWLQQLGYFKDAEDANFYVSKDLDMHLPEDAVNTYYNLPPIGTTENPFVGTFDGRNHVISDLIITGNKSNYTSSPDEYKTAENIGFFGTVNGGSIANFCLKNVTIKSDNIDSSQSVAGIVAGSLSGHGSVSNIGVCDSTLVIESGKVGQGTDGNQSDYVLVGKCSDEYLEDLKVVNTEVADLLVSAKELGAIEQGDDWGGSIPMQTLYDRLRKHYLENRSQNQTAYYDSEVTVVVDERTGETTTTVTGTTSSGRTLNHTIETQSSVEINGEVLSSIPIAEYTFCADNMDGDSPPYMYLYGHNEKNKKTITTITKKDENIEAMYIHNGSNCLSLNSANTDVQNVTIQSNATKWVQSAEGYIYYMDETEGYIYLNATNTEFSVSKTASTKWSKDGSFTFTYNGVECCLLYDNGWKIARTRYVVITDGNGNYMTVTGNTAYGNTRDITQAAAWSFSNGANSDGYIYTTYGNNTVYLRNNGGVLQLTTSTSNRTSWTNDGEKYSSDSYGIAYDNGWKLIDVSATYWVISDGNGNYLNATSKSSYGIGNNIDEATKWVFSNTALNTETSISTNINGTKVYLSITESGVIIKKYSLAVGTSVQNWKYDGTNLRNARYTSYYLRYNNGWSANTTASNIGRTEIVVEAKSTTRQVENSCNATTTATTTRLLLFDVTTEPSRFGYDSYFPLSLANDGTISKSNTGYVVAGGYTSESNYGDIRISKYAISNISSSYKAGESDFKSVYTINDSGKQPITNPKDYKKYENSKLNFIETLKKDTRYVYGLHFMSSQISMDHLITAPYANIENTWYQDYELPEDSIDFNLKKPGYINFFAGIYFSSNNKDNDSFFSLHKIERSGNKIISIKEIAEVYDNTDEATKKDVPYVYRYKDGTWSSANHGSTPLFKTAWIKKQSFLTKGSDIYYFEIPVNSGEYALGSVDGGTGAYLLYLDIAAAVQTVYRADTTEMSATYTTEYKIPTGMSFVENTDDFTENVVDGAAKTADVTEVITGNNMATSISSTGAGTYKLTWEGDMDEGVLKGGSVDIPTGSMNCLNDGAKISGTIDDDSFEYKFKLTRTEINKNNETMTTIISSSSSDNWSSINQLRIPDDMDTTIADGIKITDVTLNNGIFTAQYTTNSLGAGSTVASTNVTAMANTGLKYHYVVPQETTDVDYKTQKTDNFTLEADWITYEGINILTGNYNITGYALDITTDKKISVYLDSVVEKYLLTINDTKETISRITLDGTTNQTVTVGSVLINGSSRSAKDRLEITP